MTTNYVRTRKRCRRCGEEKTLAAFNKRAKSPDGYRFDCRACSRKEDKRYHASGAYLDMSEIPSVVTRWLEARA